MALSPLAGKPAPKEMLVDLAKLERELTAQRAYASEHGSVDRDWLQSTIRGVIEWVPDDDLTLIAALGGIARASPPALS